MNETLKIACVQMVSSTRVADNLASAARSIEQAKLLGAQVVVLPEYFCIMGANDTDKVAVAEDYRGDSPDDTTPIQWTMQQLARQHQIYLVAGTIPLKSPNPEKVYNTTLVYAPDGSVVARYDKIHLFGFNNGVESYDEARTIEAGEIQQVPTVWNSPWGKIGLSICYDIRFPELYRAAGDVFAWINIAAFTYTTGQAHWELLMRTRAVENQCYVVACGQGGKHENGRQTFGHSMIVDPWGVVQEILETGEGVICGVLKPARVARVRASIPALQHRVLF